MNKTKIMNIGTEETRLASHAISISGLSPESRGRIEEIGFDAWLDGNRDEMKTATPQATTSAQTRKHGAWRTCEVCDGRFLALRADAVYCSNRCKMRGSRRGLKHRGQTVTISEKSPLQVAA